MILILTQSPDQAMLEGASECEVRLRSADQIDSVLEWIESERIERIVWHKDGCSINPFALARALGRRRGPPLILAGSFHAHTRFWAERNGCTVAESLPAALAVEV
ncbi:MAG: hypothetical protein JXR96_02000 [Deltaproteobacteria bacterium]|nr:hypothetical protein [Deltaproteobacteria bacterium]